MDEAVLAAAPVDRAGLAVLLPEDLVDVVRGDLPPVVPALAVLPRAALVVPADLLRADPDKAAQAVAFPVVRVADAKSPSPSPAPRSLRPM